MKQSTKFNVGDKVFAKVKGYPFWPAIVVEDQGTKYNVKFYGTGETAIVKIKDLYYYLKHKAVFTKSLKRKDYNDAIEEIEKAIAESGTDGDDESTLEPSSDVDVKDASVESVKSKKRKRSVALDKVNVQSKKRALSTNDSDDTGDNLDESIETNKTETEEISNDDAAEFQEEVLTKSQQLGDTEQTVKNGIAVTQKTKVKVKILTEDFVKAVLSYVKHVRKNKQLYEKKSPEKIKTSINEVVIAKLENGDCVGIKYNREKLSKFDNEFERAHYEEKQIDKVLSIKNQLENGSIKPEEKSDLLEPDFKLSEKEIKSITDLDLMERKKEKLKWLKKESSLIELDAKIKGCLGLDKADPGTALYHLSEMSRIEIEPLMLLKHPHVVDMVKRLRRYIGNIKEWNMNEEQQVQFEKEAELVRSKAEDVYSFFATLFHVPESSTFWDTFNKLLEDFKTKVKDLKECQIFALCSEPGSRETFLHRVDDEQDIESVVAEIERSKRIKEIASNVDS